MTQIKKILSNHYHWRQILSVIFISLFGICLMVNTLCLSGCNELDESADNGDIIIGLTDAEGDFACYTVNVLSLTLTKANGAIVDTLPLSTRVDFTQYTEMTEFLTAATIPCGVYTKATMMLDYEDADIWVENDDGEIVKVDSESILDEDGNVITTLEMSVHLEGKNSLVIAPGIPAHLTLDFDLNATHRVEFDQNGVPELTVKPILLAELNPEKPKIHRLRGPLKKVNIERETFNVIIRPFFHLLSGTHERFGTLKVKTHDSTLYEIDGALYKGKEGLGKLAEKPTFTATVVIGDLKFNPYRFEAREVYAGSSVPGGDLDVVTGNVINREDNMLTVKGATLIRADGSIVFNDTVIVWLNEDTKVSRQLSEDEHDIDDISVGQHVIVFGELNDDETDLDANYVRLLLTTLKGTVVDVTTETDLLVINLQSIDKRCIHIFDFSGTGTGPEYDADPTYYEIDVKSLDISSLLANTPVKVRGFVTPFGQAPVDFRAQTVINVSDIKAVMTVDWKPATTTAFENISIEGLTLNMEGVGRFHHLARAGVVKDLTTLSSSPSIEPQEGTQGPFWIAQDGTWQLHTSFENFIEDLKDRLEQGDKVKGAIATGLFDDVTATLTANIITIKLK
ncbi:MAG: metallophosphoesterase [Thermodesulfobacteriota bacterium]|nr:metallophosphoesterase [Thermodesulfobacteriota bacterium]